ncbi:hypothetical protein [Methanolobus bombayensis]|uniref:hypothetical protein n=1 Tax=Methanolobus bombayensis TaxID=38023 RepID=UPI001AEA848F|nr:hypothetical protein [Methanolobus bombayensis]MBP1910641.1 hypothetical protein [Methanolobus bombayensis]
MNIITCIKVIVPDHDHNAAVNILNSTVGTTVKSCRIESLDSIMKQEATGFKQW